MDLQIIWFILLGVLLAGYAVLDGFDLGVGILHPLAKNDHDRRVFINAIGPIWDGNEVWLVTFGGALFAAFPEAYATIFSAFYTALMLVLTALIFRAASIEFRSKIISPTWRKLWDFGFFASSVLAALLFGVAIGNGVIGISLDARGVYTGSLFDELKPYPLLVGLLGNINIRDIRTEVILGDSWHEICRYVKKHKIDLVIMATHGLTGLKHVLMGSTAERVVQHADCPVLTVKSFEREFVDRPRLQRSVSRAKLTLSAKTLQRQTMVSR